MRWFWEPYKNPPDSRPLAAPPLPTRKLNLTELKRFADAMAAAVGGSYSLSCNLAHTQIPNLDWADLEGLLPDQLVGVHITALGPATDGQQPRKTVDLALNRRPSLNVQVAAEDEPRIRVELTDLWESLGRPIYKSWWFYPAGLVLALAAALAGAVVLWFRKELSLWLIPLVLLVLWTAYTVGSRTVASLVERSRNRFGPMDIDYRLLEKARLDRASKRAQWTDRLVGAGITVALGAVGVLVKIWIES